MGSGTTAISALKLGIDFIGCEISNEYVEIAKQRLDNLNYTTYLDKKENYLSIK